MKTKAERLLIRGLFLYFLWFFLGTSVSFGAVIYVKKDIPFEGNGSSWKEAFSDLQDALEVVAPGDEIWVAAGIYRPSRLVDSEDLRSATFSLKGDMALYGGFEGTETFRGGRDWEKYATLLQGDLGIEGSRNDDSYHVVTIKDNGNTVRLDGFFITLGNADGAKEHRNGGGVYASGGQPVLENCILCDNLAAHYGGALFGIAADINMEHCNICRNRASSCGGGLYSQSGNLCLKNLSFRENEASNGGGLYNHNSISSRIERCTFSENLARNNGGGVFSHTSTSLLENCTFWNNESRYGYGGGIHSYESDSLLVNVTVAGNRAKSGGGGISFWGRGGDLFVLANAVVWGNSPQPPESQIYRGDGEYILSHSALQGDFPGSTETLLQDPELKELAHNGGVTRTCALSEKSPARYAGLSPGEWEIGGKKIFVPEEDQRGLPRLKEKGADMGAYQYVPSPSPSPVPENTPTSAPTFAPVPTSAPTSSPFPSLTAFPTEMPTSIPLPTLISSPTLIPTPTDVPQPTPVDLPQEFPALILHPLSGDILPGDALFPRSHDAEELENLQKNLGNPESPLRKKVEIFLEEQETIPARKEDRKGISLFSEREETELTLLGIFFVEDIALKNNPLAENLVIPFSVMYEISEEGGVPLFFAMIKEKAKNEGFPEEEVYVPHHLEREQRLFEKPAFFAKQSAVPQENFFFRIKDQEAFDRNSREHRLSAVFAIVQAQRSLRKNSLQHSGGCKENFFPGVLLLGLPLFLFKW